MRAMQARDVMTTSVVSVTLGTPALKPHGFHLSARVLEFPGGMPGDVGLFLIWGQ